ncbi:hypothetical protein [Halalkalicoccus salilacus]|uniref:hypothetical protein n=1 Tax=Halalkalicoccus TaxID=332246 RepID=UPI002F96A59C
MDRRKVLLGSGSVFVTALAGCSSLPEQSGGVDDSGDSENEDTTGSEGGDNGENGNNEEDSKNNEKEDEESKKENEEEDHDDEREDIPGFDREEFEIDSDVIRLKKLAYQDHKLDVQVMVTTTDQDVLAEELRALAPGFKRAIRDFDAEEFFSEVNQIKITLYDRNKEVRFAIFVDIQWLRECYEGEMTNEEFADRIMSQVE